MIKIAKFSTGRTGMNAPSSSPPAHDAPRPGALLSPELPAPPNPFRQAITDAWLKDEATHVRELLAQARLPADEQARVQALAADLVGRVRVRAKDQGAIEAFMRQYDLGSEEGVLLGFHAGLSDEGSVVSPAEAGWVVQRLAELLEWRAPQLPPPVAAA